EVTRAVAELTGKDAGVPTPTFLPHRRSLPALIRDVGPLPDAWHRPATRPLLALLEAHPAPMAGREPVAEPVPVAPGTLGSWTDQAVLAAHRAAPWRRQSGPSRPAPRTAPSTCQAGRAAASCGP